MLTDEELKKLETAVRDRIPIDDLWRDVTGRVFPISQVCWFATSPKGLEGRLADGSTVLLSGQEIGRLAKYFELKRLGFQRTHNSALTNLARVSSVERRPDDYALHFGEGVPPAPVTPTYADATAVGLGAGHTLDHLTPLSPYAAAIDELQLINLGEEEAHQVAPGDVAAAEAWRDKWWIENFDRPTMLRYFKLKSRDTLDKTKIIRNAIWQRYLSVKWGLWEPDYGDTRDLYYHPVEDILARHNLLTHGKHKNDSDTVHGHLRDMVIQYKLLDYEDFEFPDPNPHLRHIGDRHPHLIAFAEKEGFRKVLDLLVQPYGASWCAVKGEPSAHAMERFAGQLKAAFDPTHTTVHIFGITDLNPGGASIAQTIVEDLQAFGIPKIRYHTLVDTTLYEDWQIKNFRKELAKYRQHKNGKIEPVGTVELSYVTKARAWFKTVLKSDTRFIRERALPSDAKEIALFGIQANTAKPDRIRQRFHDAIAPHVEPAPVTDPAGVTAARASLAPRWVAKRTVGGR